MYLITGGSGQLGQTFKSILSEDKAYYPDSATLDITSKESLQAFLEQHSDIKFIINCAAYTQVDIAEDETQQAHLVNVVGAKNLAESGLPLIHISTDYVFNGLKNIPYVESDAASPMNVYGKTKLEGEQEIIAVNKAAIIIRTSWLYSEFRGNFLKTMLRLFDEKDHLNIVFDQIGTPTYAKHLADYVIQVCKNFKPELAGIYHYSNEGVASWYDFAYEILQQSGKNCNISPITSDNYKTKAKRPYYSVLNKQKIKDNFKIEIPHWKEGVAECLKNLS